jgi:hypothetical protein
MKRASVFSNTSVYRFDVKDRREDCGEKVLVCEIETDAEVQNQTQEPVSALWAVQRLLQEVQHVPYLSEDAGPSRRTSGRNKIELVRF